jgi:putative hydrolase of the HAD superfamily
MTYRFAFDADNTLWDTNAVFRDAQVEMLSVLASKGLLEEPEDHVEELRRLDRQLMGKMGRNEYDFRALADALIIYYRDACDPGKAVKTVVEEHARGEGYSSLAKNAYERFSDTLKEVPDLLLGVRETLRAIGDLKEQHDVTLALFSEGNEDRLYRILEVHNDVAECFDLIRVIGKKDVASFEDLRQSLKRKVGDSENPTCVMVGDSINSDIRPANKAGFVTVYKPADFEGRETPADEAGQPDFTIEQVSEVIDVFPHLGNVEKQVK